MADRDQDIAEMAKTPGWAALKDLIQQAGRYQPVRFDQVNVTERMWYQHGRMEQALDILKAVDAAVKKTQP